jgi:hypothetical protein
MTNQIQDLVRFYAQKYHVPITLLSDSSQVESWDSTGLVVALPSQATLPKTIADLAVLYDANLAKNLQGDLITLDDVPMARVGRHWIVMLFCSQHPPAINFARKVIDQHLPRLCRKYRHEQKNALVESMADCVQDRRRELQSSLREDGYKLEGLSLQIMQLSRKLESDRQVLRLFEHSPEWIQARSTRTYVDLMKLVPSVYSSFSFEDEVITGTTHEIAIEYYDYTYRFEPYTVEVNLREGKVRISGGTEHLGYIHPHITDEPSNICWGNISHLVNRLYGELDLFGLFQLVHQYLGSYNEADPYQKIEKWDPNYEEPEDDDEPYCSFCDDYGHSIEECDSCWWCHYCNEFVDHDESDCPNGPVAEREEAANAVVEQETA